MLCTQCGHSNPDGASHCASCAAPLPAMSPCPSCQEFVSTDAYFCAHCGTPLQSGEPIPVAPKAASQADASAVGQVPPTEVVNLTEAIPAPMSEIPAIDMPISAISQPPDLLADDDSELKSPPEEQSVAEFTIFPEDSSAIPPKSDVNIAASSTAGLTSESETVPPSAFDVFTPPPAPLNTQPANPRAGATQIQQPMAYLVHVRSDTKLLLPLHLDIVHLGKPNERVPPDIDMSGFPDSDVVSRVHADLRLEADGYYLQDLGSANGTYVNNQALRTGDRYRLRTGDRVSLGKEDKVSFIFNAG
ncbi:Glycogen accumulation regulator GarA [Acaryochloris thomasi RCC1774]|uniref:Glycogen accumulation regulator GarA n=1 Tax=Acaryochloris thomasi RCC1774 TaxID=1764569 RepID=A0A2W1JM04_9CYAN|nr:FHA domain-containing protein [Acaryochloris thomasi]PZD74236.1 Glycogen accumulation regulator GarA [Acaryochloris thomasi RCC1774]